MEAKEQEDKLYCPKCGSSQLVANKKGFGAGKALGGAILTGGVGLLAGFIGSGKVKVTCLKCGSTWEPGQLRTTPLPPSPSNSTKKEDDSGLIGCAAVFIVIIIFVILIAANS